jgi:opacity protein-like surface antigen
MTKYAIAAGLLVLATSALYAADPVTQDMSRKHVFTFSTSTSSTVFGGSDVEYRYMFANSRLAAIFFAGFGQESFTTTGSTTSHGSVHSTDLGAGLRRNFTPGEQLRPFVQFDVARSSSGDSCGAISISPNWNYTASGGAEYFLGKRFSVEGRAGVRYARGSFNCNGAAIGVGTGVSSESLRTLATFRSALAVNFYF